MGETRNESTIMSVESLLGAHGASSVNAVTAL